LKNKTVLEKETETRENYHHGDLRRAILDCACEHLRQGGTDCLSLRAMAREIGVSATAPYRHFESKNALFAGIATLGLEILESQLEQVQNNKPKNSLDSLVDMGAVYLRFADQHSEKYQLMLDSSMLDSMEYPALMEARARVFKILVGAILDGQRTGVYRSEPVEKLAVQLATPRVPESYETPAVTALKHLSEDLGQVAVNIIKAIRV
jgi:AcrR family transcriptional regulator